MNKQTTRATVEREYYSSYWKRMVTDRRELLVTDHGDHVTSGASHEDGPWVSLIAQPEQRDGYTVWFAHAWCCGVLVGDGFGASAVDALGGAYWDALVSGVR